MEGQPQEQTEQNENFGEQMPQNNESESRHESQDASSEHQSPQEGGSRDEMIKKAEQFGEDKLKDRFNL
jgi:hypothetical protein